MTMLDITRPAMTWLGQLAGFPQALYAAVADWRARTATRNALRRLTDRELEDIGLDRWDVEALTGQQLR